jgi:hypothetical protein
MTVKEGKVSRVNKYKLKEHVTAKMLTEIGFIENAFGENKPVQETEEKEFTAIRTNKGVAVSIDHITYDGMKTYINTIDVYRFVGKDNDHKEKSKVRNWLPYIKDLIEKGWIV